MTTKQNYKQKTLALIPRRKELTFGCLVKWRGVSETPLKVIQDTGTLLLVTDGVSYTHRKKEIMAVIGHPITHADLIRAVLNEGYEYGEYSYHPNGGFTLVVTEELLVTLPLNYRTIEDIPEDDPMWQQLYQILVKE